MHSNDFDKILVHDPMADPVISDFFLPFLKSFYPTHTVIINKKFKKISRKTGCSIYSALSSALSIQQIIDNESFALHDENHFQPFFNHANRITLLTEFRLLCIFI